jgi:hypothetical protein
MRIDKLLCSFALLALTGASNANVAAVDPTNDSDCAILFEFFDRMAVAKQAPKEIREQTLIMGLWFETKWDQEHPGQNARQGEHFTAMVKAMGEDPKAYRDTLVACSERANADPVFDVFVKALRGSPPPAP